MEAIDIILLVVALVAVVTGAMRGFLCQAGTIVGLVVGVLACRLFGDAATRLLVGSGSEHETLLRAAAYTGVFIVSFIGVSLVARLLDSAFSAVCMGWVNRLAGAVFRLALWMVLASLVLNLWLLVSPESASTFEARPWREAVVDLAPRLLGYFTN